MRNGSGGQRGFQWEWALNIYSLSQRQLRFVRPLAPFPTHINRLDIGVLWEDRRSVRFLPAALCGQRAQMCTY